MQLKHVDLSIPGNGGMDINVTRVYTSLQTNQYPQLGRNGLGWVMHFGRIVAPRPYQSTLCNQGAFPLTTKENPSLELPDSGRELLVLNHINNDGTLITRSNWRATCAPGGVGMIVTSPEGTRYTMDQYDVLHDEPSWVTTRIEDLQSQPPVMTAQEADAQRPPDAAPAAIEQVPQRTQEVYMPPQTPAVGASPPPAPK